MSGDKRNEQSILNEDDFLGSSPATEETLLAIAGLITSGYDYISITYPTTSSEVYVYKTGGSGGATVGTVTIVYVDATKNELSTVTKT
jgi:hypothetical protein